jgi:hypothetical protein
MSDQQHGDDIRALIRDAFLPVDADLKRDLWPAMSRRLNTRMRRIAWYDWALGGFVGGVVAAFPELILILLYHL